jgi:hypothetical protein
MAACEVLHQHHHGSPEENRENPDPVTVARFELGAFRTEDKKHMAGACSAAGLLYRVHNGRCVL